MAGVKLGTRVLQVGPGDLIAALARRAGLSGRAAAIVETEEDADRVQRAAEHAGTLVEIEIAPFGAIPYERGSFDLVVLRHLIGPMRPRDRVVCLQQVFQVLRVGGRCLIIETAMRGGLGALFSKRSVDTTFYAHGGAEGALKAEGYRPVRVLAERNGLVFVEGMKPV